MSKKKNEFWVTQFEKTIQRYNEASKKDVFPINKWNYLRGINTNGIVVHVFPFSTVRFGVEIKGKMGWSEGLMGTEKGDIWGGSGTYKVFNSYDDALDAGIERVDELILEMDNNEES